MYLLKLQRKSRKIALEQKSVPRAFVQLRDVPIQNEKQKD